MATVNARTLDACERTHFYRVNQLNVPVQLPFDLVTVDADLQYYEPRAMDYMNAKGQTLRGRSTGAVFLPSNQGLPVTPPGSGLGTRGKAVVWEYYGV